MEEHFAVEIQGVAGVEAGGVVVAGVDVDGAVEDEQEEFAGVG